MYVQITRLNDTDSIYRGKTGMTEQIITTDTGNHSIEVVDGQLTIVGDPKTLTPAETEQLLDVLLIWRYCLEAVLLDTLEDSSGRI